MSTRVLVLDYNESSGIVSCFCKPDLIKIRIYGSLPDVIEQGKWITFDTSLYHPDEQEIINLPSSAALISDPKRDDYIYQDEGKLVLSAWIGFSDQPHHVTYDRKLGFADWYGFVDCSVIKTNQAQRVYGSWIKVNDLDFKKNGTTLFKVYQLKGPINSKNKSSEVKPFMDKLLEFEQKHSRMTSQMDAKPLPSHQTNLGDGFRPPKPQLQQAPLYPIMPVKQNHAPPPQSNQMSPLLNVINQQKNSRPVSVQETPLTRTQSPVVSSSINYLPARQQNIVYNSISICMDTSDPNFFLVWLADTKEAVELAMNQKLRNQPQIRLGSNFSSHFGRDCVSPDGIIDMYDVYLHENRLPFPIQIISSQQAQASLQINLCSPNSKFLNWTIFTGVVILDSPDVGFVLTTDTITLPERFSKVNAKQMLAEYMGEPLADKMKGNCRLEKHRIPRELVDKDYKGPGTVKKYVWRLYEVVGTVQNARTREAITTEDNLRDHARKMGEEDDIARQKRLNENMRQLNMGGGAPRYSRNY